VGNLRIPLRLKSAYAAAVATESRCAIRVGVINGIPSTGASNMGQNLLFGHAGHGSLAFCLVRKGEYPTHDSFGAPTADSQMSPSLISEREKAQCGDSEAGSGGSFESNAIENNLRGYRDAHESCTGCVRSAGEHDPL
jgi:hypothetical protein